MRQALTRAKEMAEGSRGFRGRTEGESEESKEGLWRYVRYCVAVAPFALLFWVCLVLVQWGVIPTSTGNTNPYQYRVHP